MPIEKKNWANLIHIKMYSGTVKLDLEPLELCEIIKKIWYELGTDLWIFPFLVV